MATPNELIEAAVSTTTAPAEKSGNKKPETRTGTDNEADDGDDDDSVVLESIHKRQNYIFSKDLMSVFGPDHQSGSLVQTPPSTTIPFKSQQLQSPHSIISPQSQSKNTPPQMLTRIAVTAAPVPVINKVAKQQQQQQQLQKLHQQQADLGDTDNLPSFSESISCNEPNLNYHCNKQAIKIKKQFSEKKISEGIKEEDTITLNEEANSQQQKMNSSNNEMMMIEFDQFETGAKCYL